MSVLHVSPGRKSRVGHLFRFAKSIVVDNAVFAVPRLFQALRLVVVFVVMSIMIAPAAFTKEAPRFERYDVPLYDQVLQQIRDKIAARLGNERLTHDRYFIIPFAYENDGNDPKFSHSFITVVRVFAYGKSPSPDSEFKVGTYKKWNFEALTISWLPADFLENPNLCVFCGVGARLFPHLNRCPISPGHNFNLQQTLHLASDAKLAVGMWGPYEIARPGFDLAVRRKQLLDSGKIKYRADDRLYQKPQIAISCFHAMASLDEPFPKGGAFGTGFMMWGLNGTARVLIEYTTRANRKGLLLEPVDVKRDRSGFVYAPTRDSNRGIYNPFASASAYRR